MDPILGAALATGAADFLGGVFTNRSNAKEARRNREFQERMSSTSAQRAVKDYAAAGLNPALAYDRPASTPGGSQAQMENPVGKAISTGMQAKALASQVSLNEASAEKMAADAGKARVEGANALVQGQILHQQRLLQGQELALRIALQPHQVRAAALANMRDTFGLDKAEAESGYYKMMGRGAFAIDNLAGPIGGLLGGGLGLAAMLRRGGGAGMAASSAQGVRGMFKAPRPRPAGTWEEFKKQERRPGGWMPNTP